jgi:hypothetical protein
MSFEIPIPRPARPKSEYRDVVICHFCGEPLSRKVAWKKPVKGTVHSFHYFHVGCYEKRTKSWEKRGSWS